MHRLPRAWAVTRLHRHGRWVYRVRLPRQGAPTARAAVTAAKEKHLLLPRTPPSISLPKGLVTDLARVSSDAAPPSDVCLCTTWSCTEDARGTLASGGKSEIAINQAIDLEPVKT